MFQLVIQPDGYEEHLPFFKRKKAPNGTHHPVLFLVLLPFAGTPKI
jgi:hypothetical protein